MSEEELKQIFGIIEELVPLHEGELCKNNSEFD